VSATDHVRKANGQDQVMTVDRNEAARFLRLRAQAEPRTCVQCGVSFKPIDISGKAPQRVCSAKCVSVVASRGRKRDQNGKYLKMTPKDERGRFVAQP